MPDQQSDVKRVKAPPSDRVRHWNTFIDFAGEAMEAVHKLATGKAVRHTPPSFGLLDNDKAAVAKALVMLCIAIEARANHLIDEAATEGRWKDDAKPDVIKENSNFWEKWVRLPHFCRVTDRFDKSRHHVVLEIWEYRDRLMHAKFDECKDLPKPDATVRLFERWIDAMKDMNAVLRGEEPDSKIDGLKVFAPIESP